MKYPTSIRNPDTESDAFGYQMFLRFNAHHKIYMPANIHAVLSIPLAEVIPGAGSPGSIIYTATGDPVKRVTQGQHPAIYSLPGTVQNTYTGAAGVFTASIIPSPYFQAPAVFANFNGGYAQLSIGLGVGGATRFIFNGAGWELRDPPSQPPGYEITGTCTADLVRLS